MRDHIVHEQRRAWNDDVWGDAVFPPVIEPRRIDPEDDLFAGRAEAWGEADLGLFPRRRMDEEDADFYAVNFFEGAATFFLILGALVGMFFSWIGSTIGKWRWANRLWKELKMAAALVWKPVEYLVGCVCVIVAFIYLMGTTREDEW